MTTTPRLRELETRLLEERRCKNHTGATILEIQIVGYKMALEDRRPVLEAARKLIVAVDEDSFDKYAVYALKDALAEVPDA